MNDRASDLSTIKDDINQSVNVLTAATQGLTSIESTLKQMKALAQSAISTPESATRASLASQFNELRSQVDALAADSSYNGINLLKNQTGRFSAGADYMTVKFNEQTQPSAINQLVVSGFEGDRLQHHHGDLGTGARRRLVIRRCGARPAPRRCSRSMPRSAQSTRR